MPQERWHIGQVARETGISIHTIRFYERIGLLRSPSRSEGKFREFNEEHLLELLFIRKAQNLGFSLLEIRELLVLQPFRTQDCLHVRQLLRQALSRVERKLDELLRLRHELKTSLRNCNRVMKQPARGRERGCPVLAELKCGGTGQRS